MSGPSDVTVVWLDKGPAREDAVRALEQWGRARGIRVLAATESSGDAAIRIDFTVADRVEKELDRAREAIAAVDADAAERALARAESLLRDHPELPQAAWLRAEVHRGWAARFTRVEPRDEQRAQIAWQDADALDGGRVAGIGEQAFPPRAHAKATLLVRGAPSRRVVARLDGTRLSGTDSADGTTTITLDAPPAEHQLVVTVDDDVAFASWVSLAMNAPGTPPPTIPIHVGDDGACSGASLATASRDGDGVKAQTVSCDHWVAAVASERRGAVLVARCERSSCGPFVEWRSEGGLDSGSGGVPPPPRAWPAWATWTALGVGAVAATTVALIATGVLEARPTEQRFVSGGVRIE